MLVLGIESSCDETACAVVEDGRIIHSNIISSQIDTHKLFGGVVPEVASRMHLEVISKIAKEALDEANLKIKDIDLIGATKGPGLIGALLVGLSYAKAISFSENIPFVGVNHMRGHICANYLSNKNLEPPFISLVVSGGHTYLIIVKNYVEYEILGSTQDDAAGEAYDKVARKLGLGYPGGPKIDKLAAVGKDIFNFPRVMLKEDNYDFSFSGLKTAVLNQINSMNQKGIEINKEDMAASFQDAVMDVLVEKTLRLSREKNIKKVAISGGVAANSELRRRFQKLEDEGEIIFYAPDKILCTDNAAMIASAAYYTYLKEGKSEYSIKASPNLNLE